jgi:hypothetical protein
MAMIKETAVAIGIVVGILGAATLVVAMGLSV